MPAQVVSFLRRVRPVSRDWAQEELAEFYRVEAALLQAGMRIETDRGVTDEGDPWFAFCRADDGETFIHFARIDGRYIIAGPAYEGVAQGYDFPELVRDLISRHPLVQPQLQRRNNTNIFMHPAALLIAVVGTAFFKTADAKAAETGHHDGHKGEGERRHLSGAAPASLPAFSAPAMIGSGHAVSGQIILDAAQTLTLVASAMAAMAPQAVSGHARSLASPAFASLIDWTPPAPTAEAHDAGGSGSSGAGGSGSGGSWVSGSRAADLATLHQNLTSGSSQAMSQLISLAAVLQDLPRPAAAPAAADALNAALSMLSDTARHAGVEAALQAAAPPAPAPAPAAAPPPASAPAPAVTVQPPATAPAAEVKAAAPVVLVVELNSASLPDIAAVRLVRDLGAGVNHESVVKLDQIPDILAQLIAKGDQIHQSLTGTASTTVDTHDAVGGSGGSSGSGGASGGSGSSSSPTSPTAGTGTSTTPQPDTSHSTDASHPVDGAKPADGSTGLGGSGSGGSSGSGGASGGTGTSSSSTSPTTETGTSTTTQPDASHSTDASHTVDGAKPTDSSAPVDSAKPGDSVKADAPTAPPPVDSKPADASPPATVDHADTLPTGPATTPDAPAADQHHPGAVTVSMMEGIISFFAAYAPIEVMVSGHGIVIYDTRIMTDSAALEKADSVTYTFDDGSTVSLVGSSITLHAAGALA